VSENGSIDPGTSIGAIRLAVADLDVVASFYREAIGLSELAAGDGTVQLGAARETLVELVGDPGAPPRPAHTTGLFHLAILVPSRADRQPPPRCGSSTRAGASAGHPTTLVSEALYLSDPEERIEIYRDRPRDQWPVRDGVIQMSTEPLDLDGVASRAPQRETAEAGMPPGTRIGHVHLNVAALTAAEAFYSGALGFDVTVRGYPGALFLSAGSYHHHIGLNTWAGEGPSPAPVAAGCAGSRSRCRMLRTSPPRRSRLREAGYEPRRDSDRSRSATLRQRRRPPPRLAPRLHESGLRLSALRDQRRARRPRKIIAAIGQPGECPR
jgi:catechol 2,3-dioxygenase